MAVRIYSTLTGREDQLVPMHPDGVLRMYVCGMTPKYHPHVGHARLFVAMDVVRRYLIFRGYRVKFVQNFTDVDDKIIARASTEGRSAEETAQEYMDSYFEVMDRLAIRRADEYPTVTAYMEPIKAFIGGLIAKDHAYRSDSGDVWFSVASFPEYGKLSHRDLNSQLVAARKELEPGKRDPRDFALWKHARESEPAWPSPWGAGRPGWHIECSTMVRDVFNSDQIDVHGGGADLIFPHHENEIAQSESLTGRAPFANHWAHTGLVVLSGGDGAQAKMAHSAENFTTLESILERYDPQTVRYYLLATHYRSSLSFVVDDRGDQARVRGLEDARGALGRLRRALGFEPLDRVGPLDEPTVDRFTAAMDADFNTPDALAVLFDLAREINTQRTAGVPDSSARDRLRRTLTHLLDVIGLDLEAAPTAEGPPLETLVALLGTATGRGSAVAVLTESGDRDQVMEALLLARRELRGARKFAEADQLRDQLKELGVVVEDKPGGTSTWRLDL